MTQLDRRRVLTSLAGGVAVAGVSYQPSHEAVATSKTGALPERALRHYGWVLAQRGSRTSTQHPIDYWCGPFAPIRYENYLPPQIARGLIAYEDFPYPIDSEIRAIEAFNEAAELYGRDWLDPETLDYLVVKPDVGPKDFQFVHSSLVGEKNTAAWTAMIAIDSPFGDFGRPEARSAFSSCYKSIVGLSHIGERGFAQQKHYSRTSLENDFVRGFLRDTSLCDTVIVTSSGLLEIDAGLSPYASTEDLVGEQVRRLSYALMEPSIRKRIVSNRGSKQSQRFLALSSVTLNDSFLPLWYWQKMLDRQSAFVSASFAPVVADDLPLFIATSRNDDLEGREGITDMIASAALISGYAIGPDMVATVQAPPYQTNARRHGWLDLITLWPFKVKTA